MDGCYKAAQELYAQLNQKTRTFKKLYDSYKAFQDDWKISTSVWPTTPWMPTCTAIAT